MGEKKMAQDYSMVCRTCLQSNVEMLNLSALITENIRNENSKISYMECLKMCIQVEESLDVELPKRICLECASALQVAYWFMKNASQAQELLKLKLREIKRKKQQIEMEAAAEELKKPKRYRCKICNVKVETKRNLKDHVKLHLDIIVYNCQLCSFESHNRNSLSEHYLQLHGLEASKEQLKPKTKTSGSSSSINNSSKLTSTTSTQHQKMLGAIKNEHFEILKNENDTITQPHTSATLAATPKQEQSSYETFATTPLNATNTLCSTATGPLQVSTIITTNLANMNTITTAPFNTLEGDLSTVVANNNDLSMANEFMVMADGSLEKVMNKGVVIEYITVPNDSNNITLNNNIVLDNILQVQNLDNNSAIMLETPQNDIVQMDVDDLIIEDPADVIESTTVPEAIPPPLDEEIIPVSIIEQPKKIVCKICTKDFTTQEQLKNHMLTHNEIPHFFCDKCKFYTFFKIDLHQHYKSKHNLQPTNKQLQPKNKQKSGTSNDVYACDLCFYEADAKADLKNHYKIKHNIEANEIHIKSSKVAKTGANLSPLTAKAKAAALGNKTNYTTPNKNIKIQPNVTTTPDYPNGLNCRKCHEVFYWRNKLYEHYKLHNAEEAALKQEKQLMKMQNKTTNSSNLYAQNNKNSKNTKTSTVQASALVASIAQTSLETTNTNATTIATSNNNFETLALNVTTPNCSTFNSSLAPLTPSSSSTYTLPSDAIPQIVETELTIENDMDFDFNGDEDALFGDFDDDDVDVENDSDDNDTEFRNVLLTSDDDFEDMLEEQNTLNMSDCGGGISGIGATTTQSFCAHCQKSFLSQYQFENHMFVHRGLAPYRCEMCTNLYNTKRCLIRHYKAVHKSVPTRDMIQAKGDKVCGDKTDLEDLKIEETCTFICAKCPYESTDLNAIKLHLNSNHNINDESYIMKKLPFECPRCIRSFASKIKVLRHLARNHSSTPINQHQIRFDNIDNLTNSLQTTKTTSLTQSLATSAVATQSSSSSLSSNALVIATSSAATSMTTTTATLNNHVNMMKTDTNISDTNASCGFNNVYIKQEYQQQYPFNDTITTTRTTANANNRNKLSIENAIAPKDIMVTHYKPESFNKSTAQIFTSSGNSCSSIATTTTTLAYNETFNSNINESTTNPTCLSSYNFKQSPTALDAADICDDQPLFKCKICHLTCCNLDEFNQHSKRIECRKSNPSNSDADRMLFECEICHCNYKTMYLLKHHLKRHIGRKFFCPNCPKTFINKVELEAHKHVHSGERPHKCDACTKSFRYVHHLKRHKDSVHLGKRHACTQPNCGRKFTTLAQLKVHIWTHNGIVPYKCPFCYRLFKKRLLLREHCLKVHNVNLSEEEIAEIFRNSLGYTNPHDFTVTIGNGKMLRRGDLETMGATGVIKSSFK